jgi:hypothetical protein
MVGFQFEMWVLARHAAQSSAVAFFAALVSKCLVFVHVKLAGGIIQFV